MKHLYYTEYFPRLYGPLNIEAVVDVSPYELTSDGKFPSVASE